MAATGAQLDGRRIATAARTGAPVDSMSLAGSPDTIVMSDEPGRIKCTPASTWSSEPIQDLGDLKNVPPGSEAPLTPIVRLPKPEATPASYAFDMRGQWEGTVTHVGPDEFNVILRDILNPGGEEYDAVFSTEEIADEDRDLLKEGAILYWTIGYEQRRGQLRRVSEVRLRRLPAWSRADLARVEQAARELDDLFAP